MQEDLALFREYETLRRSLERHERHCESLRRRLAELERSGKLLLPKYFGEFLPPQRSPEGKVLAWTPLLDGIFLTDVASGRLLAVHEAVAERYLTAVAAAFGEFLGEFCFFDESMAVALFELSSAFPEIKAVLDMPPLYATLRRLYPAYVAFYNDICRTVPIPATDAAEAPFLLL
ncbi:MAG: hypothetical protein HFG26_04455 [Provencibacterium sp.]|nr:hypothetical protein [Provencibacterium sp.]